jgi:flagellar biosynthesis protein FliR
MLRDLLTTDVYKLLLVFARMGAAIMVFPGLGSSMVLARARLLLAMAISLLLVPTVSPLVPAMPPDPLSLFFLVAGEVTIGMFLGLITQILMSPLDLAGSTIGYAVGITNVFTFDPVTQQQSQLLTGFLNLTAITAVFLTDTHHLMLRALVDSYSLLVPGNPLPVDDFSASLVRVLGESFLMGIKLAAPLLVFSLTFNAALGLLNRLVPQIPVFFVGLPVQIMGGLAILMICLPPMMLWALRYFHEGIGAFLAPG